MRIRQITEQPGLCSIILSMMLLILFGFELSGCLSDPINGPEVVSHVVGRPQKPFFRPVSFTAPYSGDMLVTWPHYPADTQLNFRGYYLKLFTSHYDSIGHGDTEVALIGGPILIPTSGKDTLYRFANMPYGRYMVEVWGVRYSDPARPDSMVLSSDYNYFASDFDPRPLDNPTNLRATSVGATRVKLKWDLPKTDTNAGMLQYRIYYKDADSGQFNILSGVSAGRGCDSAFVDVPAALSASPSLKVFPERAFKFWVKAERIDTVESYIDSSVLIWSGAERYQLPVLQHSLLFSRDGASGLWSARDDSTDASGQLSLAITNGQVTLTPMNGAGVLSQIDPANGLEFIYYKTPVLGAFGTNPYTFPLNDSAGRVMYMQIQDGEYARIFFKTEPSATLPPHVNMDVTFQPARGSGAGFLQYY